MTIPWYHKTTLYQIYPRSFYDANGDGIGDLQGIIRKLDYLRELGFETIWISPFFASPQADFGYDISDYLNIAPEYGTMEDALRLIDEVHFRGMRVLFDMVMNHTSIEHPWFKESRSSRDNPKADWYIWRPLSVSPHFPRKWGESKRGVPNNWQSMTGGSGWHYVPERDQYYWASFLPFQPDLNYRNPEVKHTMFDIVRFWLEKGVDGFRLDIFNVIFKDAQFRNNPFTFKLLPTEEDHSALFRKAKYTLNQPESFDFAGELRSVCNEFGEKLLLGEASGSKQTTRKFLGRDENDGLTQVFNFGMLHFKFNAAYFRHLVEDMEAIYPHPFMPVYVFSNHDRRRSIYELGNDMRKAKLLHMFQLTVRGVPCIYYGEEIGMTSARFPLATALDPIPRKFAWLPRFIFDLLEITTNRDEVRTPMQWDASENAGFSSAQKTWLPVHENYRSINVAKESSEENSLLNTIRALLKIRKQEKALHEGSLELMDGLPRHVLGYTRTFANDKIAVLLNFDAVEKHLEFEGWDLLFKLSSEDGIKDKAIRLDGLGGMILKSKNGRP